MPPITTAAIGGQEIGVAHALVGLAASSPASSTPAMRAGKPQSAKQTIRHAPRVDAGEIGRGLLLPMA